MNPLNLYKVSCPFLRCTHWLPVADDIQRTRYSSTTSLASVVRSFSRGPGWKSRRLRP
jgi:hypothetical protein